MFNPSREEVRRFFLDTWRKQHAGEVLTGMESMTAAIIAAHPEYHALFRDEEAALGRDWLPEDGETNPFLHLSMHLAIEEQLAIDQPRGIRPLYEALLQSGHDDMAAQHLVMDCLGEMIWQAQRHNTAPDPELYLACLRGKLPPARRR